MTNSISNLPRLEGQEACFSKAGQPDNKSSNKDLLKKVTFVSAAVFLLISATVAFAFLSLPFNLVVVPIALAGLACFAIACKIHFRKSQSLNSEGISSTLSNPPTQTPQSGDVAINKEKSMSEIKSIASSTYSSDCDWNDKENRKNQRRAALSVLIQDSVVINTDLIFDLKQRGYKVILEPKNPNNTKIEADEIHGQMIINNCKLKLVENLEENFQKIELNNIEFYISKTCAFEQREKREIDEFIVQSDEIYNEEFINDLNLFQLFPTVHPRDNKIQAFHYYPKWKAFLAIRGQLKIPGSHPLARYVKIGETKLFIPLTTTYFLNTQNVYQLINESEVLLASEKKNSSNLIKWKEIDDNQDEKNNRIPLEELVSSVSDL